MNWKYKIDLTDNNVFVEIEKERGVIIPQELKEFIIANNAATPSSKSFKASGVEKVFEAVLSFNQNEEDTYSGYTALEVIKDKNFFPFGIDPFGNYICYNISDSVVEVIEHETGNILSTQKNIDDFINSLY